MFDSHFAALIGGLIIGGVAISFLILTGRLLGVSGIIEGAMVKSPNAYWKIFFLLGLVTSPFVMKIFLPNFEIFPPVHLSWEIAIISGFLVGFGTRLGSGCTSGHGICGIGRFSRRSVVATMIFMLAGMCTVFLRKYL